MEDVIGVFDGSTQLFQSAKVLKLSVARPSKTMEHPIESGSVISDHHVILPAETTLQFVLDPATFKSVYLQIERAFESSRLLTVQTKVRRFANVIIQSMPHDESGEFAGTILLGVSLKQVLIASVRESMKLGTVKNGRNSSTQKSGSKQQKPVRRSLLSKLSGVGVVRQ